MGLQRTIDAASEPVSLSDAKANMRVTDSSEDALIGTLIAAARQMAENLLGRALITQTWRKTIDAFADAIELPYAPVIAVTSVKYLDLDGAQQTLSTNSYYLDNRSEPAWLVPAYGYVWPDTLLTANAVEVTYTAGYGVDGTAVPAAIKQWILLAVGAMFENREAFVITQGSAAMLEPGFWDGLLDPYRIITI